MKTMIRYWGFYALALALSFSIGSCKPEEVVGEDDVNEKIYLTASTAEKDVDFSGEEFKFRISSNTKWEIKLTANWIHTSVESGEGDAEITVNCTAAAEKRDRLGAIFIAGEGVKSAILKIKQTNKRFINPIDEGGDPWIYKHNGRYYYCKTTGGNISISVSDKLSKVGSSKRIWTPSTDANAWNKANVWAPELYFIDGHWYVYYAAGLQDSYLTQRSGVLRSKTDDAFGEWEDLGMLYTGDEYVEGIVPTAKNSAYAIDLGTFVMDGQRYAVWSGLPDKNVDANQCIYIAKMSNPYTISSNRVRLSKAEKGWETKSNERINEGPAILRRNGKIFIVYSANGSWTKYYTLGYLMMEEGKDPMVAGNWKKSENGVFYRCDNTAPQAYGVNGVGHCSFTTSPDDTEDWIVYHAKNFNDSANSGRSVYIKKFGWNDDGTPNFGTPVAYKEETLFPSGE